MMTTPAGNGRLVGAEAEGGAGGRQPERMDPRFAGKVILVAEDNPTNQLVIGRQLRHLGIAYETAADGKEALGVYFAKLDAGAPFAVVLTDCHMPEMDGFDLTAAIRRHEQANPSRVRRSPIVAITANALQGEAERCLAAGMDDFIAKPATLDDLRTKIGRWLIALDETSCEPDGGGAVPDDPAARPVIDHAMIEEAFGGLDEEFREIMQLWCDTSAPVLHDLEGAVRDRDGARAAALAHGVKGGAASAALARVSAALGRVEHTARAGDWPAVDAALSIALRHAREAMDAVHDLGPAGPGPGTARD